MTSSSYSYQDFLADRIEMPVFDESIFYPAIERRKLGISDKIWNASSSFSVGTSNSEIAGWIASASLRF